MDKLRRSGILMALCCISTTYLFSQTASFANWKDNRKAAYSIIHDDFGSFVTSIYDVAYPLANARGVKICFGAITSLCGPTEWARARTMIAAGHECVNHSHNHKCGGVPGDCTGVLSYGKADFDTELGLSTRLIQNNTGVRPLFFIHPYDAASEPVLDYLKNTLGYIGSRAGIGDINTPNFSNPMKMDFFGFDGSASAVASIIPAVNYTIDFGGYLIQEFHGVDDASFGPLKRADYIALLDHVRNKSQAGQLWSATTSEVLTYKMQRDAYTISTVYTASAGTIAVNFTNRQTINTTILKTPVTVNVNVGALTGAFTATQGQTNIPTTRNGNVISFNVYPHQGNVVLKTGTTGGFNPNFCYRLTARHSNRVMALSSASTADNVALLQAASTGTREQVWRIKPIDATFYQITSGLSGKSVSAQAGSPDNGAAIVQLPYTALTSQQWRLTPNTEGFYFLSARHSDRYIDVYGGLTADRTALIQWDYNAGQNQQWRIEAVTCPTGTAALKAQRLVAFNGQLDNHKGALQWVVNSEDLKDYFEVEKRNAQQEFERLTLVNGTGSEAVRVFNFTDDNLQDGENVYRIKSVDTDGKVEYSELVGLKYATSALYNLSPNPTTDYLDVNLTACENQAVDLIIMNNLGLTIQQVSLDKAGKTHRFELNNLPNGQYTLWVQPKGKRVVTHSFIIMK